MNDEHASPAWGILPGLLSDNEEVENTLGLVNGQKSRLKDVFQKATVSKHDTTPSMHNRPRIRTKKWLSPPASNVELIAFIDAMGENVYPLEQHKGIWSYRGLAPWFKPSRSLGELNTSHGICRRQYDGTRSTCSTSLKMVDHDNALVIGSELASRLKSRYEAATEAIAQNESISMLVFLPGCSLTV